MTFLRLCLLGLLTIGCSILSPGAMAQVDMSPYTPTEKVGFAFYQMIRQPPPFSRWIEISPDYQKALPKVRLAMMDAERIRLKTGFAAYLPDRDLIPVRARARARGTGDSLEITFLDAA